jgi:hypothetical protein
MLSESEFYRATTHIELVPPPQRSDTGWSYGHPRRIPVANHGCRQQRSAAGSMRGDGERREKGCRARMAVLRGNGGVVGGRPVGDEGEGESSLTTPRTE